MVHRLGVQRRVRDNRLLGYSRAVLGRDTFEAFTHSLSHRDPDFGMEHWADSRV